MKINKLLYISLSYLKMNNKIKNIFLFFLNNVDAKIFIKNNLKKIKKNGIIKI